MGEFNSDVHCIYYYGQESLRRNRVAIIISRIAQYATGDQWRNNSTKNEGMEPKQKQHPVVGVTGDGSKSNAVKSNIA